MTDTPALVGELCYLTGIAEAARRHLKAGELLDLTPLETRCEALCARLETVSGPERETLRAAFVALVDELNRLEAELKASRDATMREIGAATQRRRATTAYGNAPLSGASGAGARGR
jgi:hypothetical protein